MTNEQVIEIIERYKLRIPPTVYYDLLADVQEVEEEQELKFIAKSDGTIEQIKNCNNCLFKKEWEKIGKLLSVVLEKQTEQEQKRGHWIEHEKSISTAFKHLRECSCCKCYFDWLMPRNSFCPNCGADMREVKE